MKNKIPFLHELDGLKDNITHTIEDNLKLKAELAKDGSVMDKWLMYQDMIAWISVCDRLGIKIRNPDNVLETLKKLWLAIRKSKLYKEPEYMKIIDNADGWERYGRMIREMCIERKPQTQ